MGAARGLRLPGRPRPVRPATAWHTSERSPLSGRASRRGWRRCHSGGGGANGGGRAPMAVRLPTGLGEGKIARRSSSSTVRKPARRRRFSDGVGLRWPAAVLRRSPWMNLATAETAGQRRASDTDDGVVSDSSGGAVETGRGVAVRTASRNDAALSGHRRAVPTVHLMRGCGAARGSHAAMARCQAGLARTAASDRWDPLVSVLRIKNTPGRK
jgi:hypothetical protein